MIFDTHAHYDDRQFDEDREAVLAGLAAAGVGRVVDIGSTVRSLDIIRELADTHAQVYGAVGLHPDDAGELSGEVFEHLRELLRGPKMVAVGEIGLDYHWDVWPHEVQKAAFKEQIRLAWEAEKPIVVHSRTAAADTMELIMEMYGEDGELAACAAGVPLPEESRAHLGSKQAARLLAGFREGRRSPGIIHSYSGSLEQAVIYTGLGFYLGIGGVVTYPTSKKLKKVVRGIDLSRLVLETDSPYLPPEELRGTRNTSANLSRVIQAIATLKEVTPEEVESRTCENALRVYGLSEE